MKTIYILPLGKTKGLTALSLSVQSVLQQESNEKVGYINLVDENNHGAMTLESIEKMVLDNQYDVVLEKLVASIMKSSGNCNTLIIEGIEPCMTTPFVDQLNRDIISNFQASSILVTGDYTKIPQSDISKFLNLYTKDPIHQKNRAIGYIANQEISSELAIPYFGFIPDNLSNNVSEAQSQILKYIDSALLSKVINNQVDKHLTTPEIFKYSLIDQAQKANKRIILPEGAEPRTLEAAIYCEHNKIAKCVLVGSPSEIKDVAEQHGLAIPSSIEIIDPSIVAKNYVDTLVELRKHKGMTKETAEIQVQDNVILGTLMLAKGDVDGLVSGAIHTTADTIRPALQLLGTDKNSSIVSSVFFMLMPNQAYVYGDCAVNPNPSPEQLANIAIQSANTAQAFGISPKVAMISYSTGNSGMGSDVEAVKEATKLAKEKAPNLLLDGPLQFDAAYVPSVGRQKMPDSKVAGNATVFIFPDLNTGNTTYKAVQRSANIISIGPVLQGLSKPVNDLSRGALVEDIIFTIAITAIQANH